MTEKELAGKIIATMAAVFEVDPSALGEDSTMDNVESWDSLRHMNLVIALEEAFGVQFTDDEVVELLSFKLIRSIIQGKSKGN